MKISKGIGIDLGTTNSCVAVMDLTDEHIIMSEDKFGVATTPSCVWYDQKADKIVVGKQAFRRRGGRPEPIISIKRWMGTNRTVKLGKREMTPEEVSAEILKELRHQISETLREKLGREGLEFVIDRAIITIPAYFGLPAIEATRKAGQLAGLEIIELLHEPTAGAVHYAWKHNITEDCTFLVFDPGGGTFDVSIVRRTAGEPEVLGISGDVFLGGDDLDRRLAELIRKRLAEDPECDYDLDFDPVNDPEDALRVTKLVLIAEGVKKRLTEQAEELLRDTTLTDRTDSRVSIEMMITREAFEGAIRELVEKMVPKCWEALAKAYKKAEITLADIDHVLLVGGTSYVPLVQQIARVNFCNCTDARKLKPADIEAILELVAAEHRETARMLINRNERARCAAPVFEDPDTCNARGAAIRAALAGLVVYNDAETVRVAFKGTGATAGAKAKVAGTVEAKQAGQWQPLSGGRVRAVLAEAGCEDEEFLDDKGNFRFRNLPVQAGAVNEYTFEVYDGQGRQVATVGRPISQSATAVDLGSGALTSAVLPVAIKVEGLERGRVVRRPLIHEMTSLPAAGDFTWRLPEHQGYLIIPIYQGNRLIKELRADIDASLPAGTPIKFHIEIDEQAYIVCRYQIGKEDYSAAIEPPSMPVPTPDEVTERAGEIKEALEYRSAGERVTYKRRLQQLEREIAEARESGDAPKVIERYDELAGLLEEVRNVRAELEPPKAQFDQLVQACMKLAAQMRRAAPDRDAGELEKNIRLQQKLGEEAAANHDQQAYGEAYQMLVTYAQGLQRELQRIENGPQDDRDKPPADPVERARYLTDYLSGMCEEQLGYAQTRQQELAEEARKARNAAEAESKKRQGQTAAQQYDRLAEMANQLSALSSRAAAQPEQVQRQCRAIYADLQRIYETLKALGGTQEQPPIPEL